MSPPLTPVPATLPGVVRRCTPLVSARLHDVRAVALSAPGADGYVQTDSGDRRLALWCIDLTDATGRAHGAGALLGLPAALWVHAGGGSSRWDAVAYVGAYMTHAAFGSVGNALREMRLRAPDPQDIPTLDGLDPNDPTLLPDGSRWVDAEALARVLVHVLGGAS